MASTELWYNSCYHSSLQCSPFKTLYGVEPNTGLVPHVVTSSPSDAAVVFHEREEFLKLIKEHLAAAQNKIDCLEKKKRYTTL